MHLRKLIGAYGITELVPGQRSSIERGIFDGRNLILVMPTGSGKSILAEWTILNSIEKGGKAIYLLPWVAAASQRAANLWRKSKSLGMNLKIFLAARRLYSVCEKGTVLEREMFKAFDILVSTPEWLDKILRSQEYSLLDVSIVVFDEVHILRDFGRGAVADKVFAWVRSLCPNAQIIAMSATVSNSAHIANWLDCEVVRTPVRPVTLVKGVMSLERLSPIWDQETASKEIFDLSDQSLFTRKQVVFSLLERMKDAKNESGKMSQVLVFLPSRAAVQQWSRSYSYFLRQRGSRSCLKTPTVLDIGDFNKQMQSAGRPLVSSKFAANLLLMGIGIHTARMNFEQREFIEKMFIEGKLNVIFCTSTLSMGINLPARFVIIPFLNIPPHERMTKILAAQMLGRAGRLGFGDRYGYGLILAKSDSDAQEAYCDYIQSESEPIESSFTREGVSETIFDTQILSLFCASALMEEILKKTLAHCERENMCNEVELAVRQLIRDRFLEENKKNLTPLGKATIESMIDVRVALDLYRFGKKARKYQDSSFYDAIIDKLAGIPEGHCVYNEVRLDRQSYSELLKMRLKESASKNIILENARLKRSDIGQVDIDIAIKETIRHLKFLFAVSNDMRILQTIEGIRLGISPLFFWLLNAFTYKEVRRARRIIQSLDAAGFGMLPDTRRFVKECSPETLKYYGLSPQEAQYVLDHAREAMWKSSARLLRTNPREKGFSI